MFSVTPVVDKLGYSLSLNADVKKSNGDSAYLAGKLCMKSRDIVNARFELLIYISAYAEMLQPLSANVWLDAILHY